MTRDGFRSIFSWRVNALDNFWEARISEASLCALHDLHLHDQADEHACENLFEIPLREAYESSVFLLHIKLLFFHYKFRFDELSK